MGLSLLDFLDSKVVEEGGTAVQKEEREEVLSLEQVEVASLLLDQETDSL